MITINSDFRCTQWLAHFNSAPSVTFCFSQRFGCDSGSLQVSTDVILFWEQIMVSLLDTFNSLFPTLIHNSVLAHFQNSFVTYANGTANGSITDIVAHRLTISSASVNQWIHFVIHIGPTFEPMFRALSWPVLFPLEQGESSRAIPSLPFPEL